MTESRAEALRRLGAPVVACPRCGNLFVQRRVEPEETHGWIVEGAVDGGFVRKYCSKPCDRGHAGGTLDF